VDDGSDNPGRRAYEEYWERQMADPEFRRVYEEEAARVDALPQSAVPGRLLDDPDECDRRDE
jgi:hypothetical protein